MRLGFIEGLIVAFTVPFVFMISMVTLRYFKLKNIRKRRTSLRVLKNREDK